ncbi:MAG: hypothetical protein RIS90_2444 [Pseudomonadota bacterium]
MTKLPAAKPETPPPWWKFGHVWLVLSGPLVVVVASFVTLYLAVTRPDPVVSEDYYRQGLNINPLRADGRDASLAPALQARNHAATGRVPDARPAPKP